MTPSYAGMRKKGEGVSTSHDMTWMCGHKHRFGVYRTVAGLRAKLPWRCQDCAHKLKAKS